MAVLMLLSAKAAEEVVREWDPPQCGCAGWCHWQCYQNKHPLLWQPAMPMPMILNQPKAVQACCECHCPEITPGHQPAEPRPCLSCSHLRPHPQTTQPENNQPNSRRSDSTPCAEWVHHP